MAFQAAHTAQDSRLVHSAEATLLDGNAQCRRLSSICSQLAILVADDAMASKDSEHARRQSLFCSLLEARRACRWGFDAAIPRSLERCWVPINYSKLR